MWSKTKSQGHETLEAEALALKAGAWAWAAPGDKVARVAARARVLRAMRMTVFS